MKDRASRYLASLLAIVLLVCLGSPILAWASASSGTYTYPVDRTLPLVVDRANLLTDSEERQLIEQFERQGTENAIEIAVVTVNSLDGKTPMDYADDFYDYNGYGAGPGKDGILLLVSMADRDWWITTHGTAYEQLTEQRFNEMRDGFLPYLSSGDYFKAFQTFGNSAARLMQLPPPNGNNGNNGIIEPPVDPPVTIGQIVSQIFLWLGIGAGGGGLSALVVTSSMRSKHKSVIAKRTAESYLAIAQVDPAQAGQQPMPGVPIIGRPGTSGMLGATLGQQFHRALTLRHRNDIFLGRSVSQSRRSRDSGSSGGGGGGYGGHTSSSGTSHGGGGGKF